MNTTEFEKHCRRLKAIVCLLDGIKIAKEAFKDDFPNFCVMLDAWSGRILHLRESIIYKEEQRRGVEAATSNKGNLKKLCRKCADKLKYNEGKTVKMVGSKRKKDYCWICGKRDFCDDYRVK